MELSILVTCIVMILIIYIVTAHIIETTKVKYLHESAVGILLGIILGLIIKFVNLINILKIKIIYQSFNLDQQMLKFDDNMFFNFFLPPIIFAAGYNLKKKYFFENFSYISFLGIVGTLVQFIIISVFAYIFNNILFSQENQLQPLEILLLSCILTSTDTVAALSLIKEQTYPKLNSILFGEGIINDAMSIVLFRSIRSTFSPKPNCMPNLETKVDNCNLITFSWLSLLSLLLEFIKLLFLSMLLGLIFGLLISFSFKKFQTLKNFPLREISLIMMVGYSSYSLSESLHLSGIISLFTCGMIMSYYTFQNLSKQSQKSTHLAFESLAYIAEAFVFTYLGFTFAFEQIKNFPFFFIIITVASLFFARMFSIFLLPCCQFILKTKINLKLCELKVIWYSGLVRGAIAFALCFEIKSKNQSIIKVTTLSVILLTTGLLTTLLQPFLNFVKLNQLSQNQYDNNITYKESTQKKIQVQDEVQQNLYNSAIVNQSIGSYQKKLNLNPSQKILFEENINRQTENEYIEKKKQEKMSLIQKTFKKIDDKITPYFGNQKKEEIENIQLSQIQQNNNYKL